MRFDEVNAELPVIEEIKKKQTKTLKSYKLIAINFFDVICTFFIYEIDIFL